MSATAKGRDGKKTKTDKIDDLFDEGNEMVIEDDGEGSDDSTYSSGDYLTEQAHHNDLNS